MGIANLAEAAHVTCLNIENVGIKIEKKNYEKGK